MLTITLLRTFFSHWLGALTLVIVLGLIGTLAFERHENTNLTTQIAALNQSLGAIKANDAQWQSSANDCSKATLASKDMQDQISAAAAKAMIDATTKAQPKLDFAKKILSQKPVGSNDYANSQALMHQLIDQRQAELKGAQ